FAERALRNIWPRSRGSFRLDVIGPDHLGPLFGFVGDQLPKFGGREREHGATEIGKPRLDLGISKASVDLLVELLDNLGRRGVWRAEAVPITRLVARQKLTHGRDVRQRVRARRGGDSERAQPTSPDVLNR